MKADHFSRDVAEFIALLHRFGVRYVVVGGEAVIYRPPNRIDLLGSIDGVDFETASRRAVEESMERADKAVPIHFIGLEDLIANKQAAGRPKDLDDLDYLLGKRRREG